ncbi:MAG: hypothetical protein HOP07_15565 [Bacteriovoracaceae bacterium]|nr:hypothetical protein [Bacteriovoracaceae bacterium]
MSTKKILRQTLLLLSFSFTAYAGNCEREELMKGYNTSSNSIFGIGISTNTDKTKGKEEAKERAYQDIVSQLRSNVESSMTLEETDKSTAYKGIVNVTTNVDKVIGIKFFKEAKDSSNTTCMAYTLDVATAYNDAQGFMKVLDKKLEDVMSAQKKKEFVDVVRRYEIAKKDIESNEWAILRADMYKTYLKKEGTSFWEKFKTAEVELDKTYDEAKKSIVFYIAPFPKYDEVALDTETMLSGKGFTAQVGGVKPKSGIEIVFKEAGKPRKTKTALGFTMVYKFGVVIRDLVTGRVLGSNKGATVQGISNEDSEDDAIASASLQMSLNVQEALKSAVPGLITE